MTSQLSPINRPIDDVNMCHLPIVVKTHPKKCALPEGRVESVWKVSSPSLDLSASTFPRIGRVLFQNPPINFPPRKFENDVPKRLFWTA